MFAIYALFVYGSGIAIIGLIMLACAPRLRLSFVNLLTFILGGFLGMIVLSNLSIWTIRYLLEHLAPRRQLPHGEIVGYLALLVGAALGGAGSVWLKTRLIDKPTKTSGFPA